MIGQSFTYPFNLQFSKLFTLVFDRSLHHVKASIMKNMLSHRIPTFIILLLASFLWVGEYVRRDLWEPDEARFALVAKEMREGHWLVPYRQGEFYSHKPPLMFWLTNVFSLVTGGEIGTVAPRLPSLLGALLALWAASRLASRWFSHRAGWLTVLLLSSSFMFWNKGGFGQIDMLLCGLQMMALYGLFTAADDPGRGRLALAYGFMGLAVLAKGPVGFLVPWLVYLAAVFLSGEQTRHSRRHLIWGPVVTLAFPAVWLALAWWQGAPEGFFPELLWKQNVGRVTGEFGGHVKPFYYFFYHFPLDFLPWSLLLPLSYHVLKRSPEYDGGRRRLVVWIVMVIVFFSFSSSKRNLYILPAYPAAAMLVAAAADHWARADERWLRVGYRLVAGLMALLGVGMLVGAFVPAFPADGRVLIPGGLALVAGSWVAWGFYRQNARDARWLVALSTCVLVTFASVGALLYPAFNDLKTPNEIVTEAQTLLAPDERIIMYKMHGEIFSLYTDRKGYMAFTDEEAQAFMQTSDQPNHMIIALERDLPAIRVWLTRPHRVVSFTSGSKKLVALVVSAN